tara:strand:+ start:68 stop:820 length:753 start_codon:yes stop_codon:yes gene_type:complete
VRYFISLAYKGTNFHGWQVQPNAVSVQQRINEGLSVLLKEEVMIMGAGRTDTGVHAKQMYAHFDTDKSFDLDVVCYRLNAFLEDSIFIKSIFKVADETHARFHASSRTYEYWLCQQKNPFLTEGAWLMYSNLDFSLMNQAASYISEVNDFSSFAKIHSDVNTHICEVRKAEWVQQGDKWVFSIEADRFLRNMVRAIVGTLVEVGKKKMTLDEFKSIIKEKNRSSAGTSAPAKGLYLVKIEYPKDLLNGDC